MAETSPYRESARDADAAELPTRTSGMAHAIGTFAIGCFVAPLALGTIEAAAVAGFGLVLAGGYAVRAMGRRHRSDRVEAFLGANPLAAPGAWISRDGSRRVRSVDHDSRVRFEELDPGDGSTLASVRRAWPLAPSPGRWRARSVAAVATLHGRALSPRCFELRGEAPREVDAARVELVDGPDGVLAVRRDAEGGLLGDTLHSNRSAAIDALRREYGPHLGQWRKSGRKPSEHGVVVRNTWTGSHSPHAAL